MTVTGLFSYTFEVPDPAAGRDFYAAFGLSADDRGDAVRLACDGRDQEQVVLRGGTEKRLHSVSFTVAPGSLDDLRARLETAGHPQVDGPGDGLWVRDPHDLLVRLVETDRVPWRPYERVAMNIGADMPRVDRAQWRSADALPRPRRLGHALIFTPDMAATEQFYLDVLGFRLSDRIGPAVSFWNTGPGDHHVFGAILSSHPGFHHSSWEVASVDEMGAGAQHMAQVGYSRQWGLGRHTLGSNLFFYVQDPWGSWVEYFTDMDQITDAWTPETWDISPAVWGPELPGDFLENQEVKA